MTYLGNNPVAVAIRVDDELPATFDRIVSMAMNDNCYYIVPNFKLKGDDTVRFSFLATAACNVLGAYSGSASGNNYSLYASTTSGSKYLRYLSGAYNSQIVANKRYNVTITPTGSTGMENDSVWTQQNFEAATDFCIGTTKVDASSAKLKGRFYGNIEVENANGLRFKGIPCIRKTDNKVGFYDAISGVFLEPIGTDPTAGDYDESHIITAAQFRMEARQ